MNHSREYRSKPRPDPKPEYHLIAGEVGDVFDCIVPFRIRDACPRHSHEMPAGTRFIIHEKTGTQRRQSADEGEMIRYVIMSFGCFHKILYNALNTRRCRKIPTGDPHANEPIDPER